LGALLSETVKLPSELSIRESEAIQMFFFQQGFAAKAVLAKDKAIPYSVVLSPRQEWLLFA